METEVLRDGRDEVEISEEKTGTGPRLRIRAVVEDAFVDLDPLELEGLTRLPFTPFPPLQGEPGDAEGAVSPGTPEIGLSILRNEFAMVGVSVANGPSGRRLRVRNMGSGAEVWLRAAQLVRISRLRHRDLAPLVDPSGLAAEREPDPDQV